MFGISFVLTFVWGGLLVAAALIIAGLYLWLRFFPPIPHSVMWLGESKERPVPIFSVASLLHEYPCLTRAHFTEEEAQETYLDMQVYLAKKLGDQLLKAELLYEFGEISEEESHEAAVACKDEHDIVFLESVGIMEELYGEDIIERLIIKELG